MSNPTFSTAKQSVNTHAKPRLLVRNGKMENDANVTSVTLLTKQWRRHESGDISTPLTAGNFLKILRIWNGNIIYFIRTGR